MGKAPNVKFPRLHSALPWFEFKILIWHMDIDDSYRQTSYVGRTLVGNKIMDHPDVFGATPVGAAPTTSQFST